MSHGGFVDVWKGHHQGREVAAKVLRTNLTSDLERIKKVNCSRLTVSIDQLTGSNTEILQGGRSVGDPPSSKHTAVVRRDSLRESVRDGIGMDGEWEYQRVCEGTCRRESFVACMSFV